MIKKLFQKEMKPEGRGRYVQESAKLSSDEVIRRGIQDLKQRINNPNRVTTQHVLDAQRRSLNASVSTAPLQVVDRSKFYVRSGPASETYIDQALKQQGIDAHMSNKDYGLFSGQKSGAGVALNFRETIMVDEQKVTVAMPPSAGENSTALGPKAIANTTNRLPARLEPLFYAHVTFHEEGHALDNLAGISEYNKEGYGQLKGECKAAVKTTEAIEGQSLGKAQKKFVERAWLQSVNETRQDVYGLIKTSEFAKEHGYTKEDMLAVCDYIHDSRISKTPNDKSHQRYTIHEGVDAATYLIEEHGLDAADVIRSKWGDKGKNLSDVERLHTGVKNMVYDRELYLDGSTFIGYQYAVTSDRDVSEHLSRSQNKKLEATLEEREHAQGRLMRAAEPHITLQDAQTINATIARQGKFHAAAQELSGMASRITDQDAYAAGIDRQYLDSQKEYLKAVEREHGFLKSLPRDHTRPEAPSALIYQDVADRDSGNPIPIWVKVSPMRDGKYAVQGFKISTDPERLAQQLETINDNNMHILSHGDEESVKAMVAGCQQLGTLEDRDNLVKRTGIDTNVNRHVAKAGNRSMEQIFDGTEHHLESIDRMQNIVKIHENPSRDTQMQEAAFEVSRDDEDTLGLGRL